MLYFAVALISQSKLHKGTGIIGERIMILHLDHANELLMKSFLLKKGYVISYLEQHEAKKGLKRKDAESKSKTLNYPDCLNLIAKKISLNVKTRNEILEFHKIRNEIQHRAIDLPLNKKEKIINFYPYFKEFYELMFPEYADDFPELF